MRYAIFDWAGNRIRPQIDFETFEDAWDYILGEMTDELGLTDEDYQEYFVEDEARTKREYRFLDPRDPRAVRS